MQSPPGPWLKQTRGRTIFQDDGYKIKNIGHNGRYNGFIGSIGCQQPTNETTATSEPHNVPNTSGPREDYCKETESQLGACSLLPPS